ncbi:hypothetical protein A0H81_07600 [Grifola frondosa]|uniref:Skg3/CAF120-like PH-like domain-containing protein n=1 Tax=Grifola frondosa TaxID=5627 RepID=A0A1C7M6X8_GRIFR|nr:hypothetical protein A0H81_07600 [Grifola frondosa]
MLRWLIAIHDAFEIYGRPRLYSWDPRDRNSMMFAYPIGPHRDLLFLDREFAEILDPREDRTSAVRMRLQRILVDRMTSPGSEQPVSQVPGTRAPTLPPLPEITAPDNAGGRLSMQLPPFSFDSTPMDAGTSARRPLTPITERSVARETNYSLSVERAMSSSSVRQSAPSPVVEEPVSVLGQPMSSSPVSASPTDNVKARALFIPLFPKHLRSLLSHSPSYTSSSRKR